MKILFAFVLVAAAVFTVTEGGASYYLASEKLGATNPAGVSVDLVAALAGCFSFSSVKIMSDGTKYVERGCSLPSCTVKKVIPPGPTNPFWEELVDCCNPTAADCNAFDFLTGTYDTANLGPKCLACDSDKEACVKGATVGADLTEDGTACDIAAGKMCSVERVASGKVTRKCADAGCTNSGMPGDAAFKKCCLLADKCNSDDATVKATGSGSGSGSGSGGECNGSQAVFASYVLLFSCLLLAYLK